MKRLGSLLLSAQIFVCISIQSAEADDSAVPLSDLKFNVGMVSGPWKLTDITMSSLLVNNYQLVSTETMVTLTTGIAVNVDVIQAHADTANSSYLAYYLKKGSSLFRCTENGPGATLVYCWEFSPAVGKINGQSQRDLNPNALLGKWTGTMISENGGTAIPMQMEFTEDSLDPSGTGTIIVSRNYGPFQSSGPSKVIYRVNSDDIIVADAKTAVAAMSFHLSSANTIELLDPYSTSIPKTLARFVRVGNRFQ